MTYSGNKRKASYIAKKVRKYLRLPDPDMSIVADNMEIDTAVANQTNGQRVGRSRYVIKRGKRKNPMKLLKSRIRYLQQALGVRTATGTAGGGNKILPGGWLMKHPVSEFDPGTAGCICIGKRSDTGVLPMHVYDLNYYVGSQKSVIDPAGYTFDQFKVDYDDTPRYVANQTAGTDPAKWNRQSTAQCDNIDARGWYFGTDHKFHEMLQETTNASLAYYVNDANHTVDKYDKIYRKGISIDFQVYGCTHMPTEYEFRVIKMIDETMAPDYDQTLIDVPDTEGIENYGLSTFRQRWQNLIRAWTINPMLKGIEPGPKTGKWFKTVAKKKIRIGEQISTVDNAPVVRGKIYVGLNEVNNHVYGMGTNTVETAASIFDEVPGPVIGDMKDNSVWKHRPHPRARYYLLVRALCPISGSSGSMDTHTFTDTHKFFSLAQGTKAITPSYDLSIRTTYLVNVDT